MDFYRADHLMKGTGHSFAQDIEMFVTVTSSPNALVSSHMGIASTVEGYGKRAKGTSMDLHSFAAKVMLMRNLDRKYMVNAPTSAMEKIMAEALPKAVFVGTREMQEKMKKNKDVNFDEFLALKGEKIRAEIEQESLETCASKNKDLLELREEVENLEDKEARLQKRISRVLREEVLEIEDEKFVVSISKREEEIQKQLADAFLQFKTPYAFPLEEDQNKRSESFLKFMEKHPPILSVDGGNFIRNSFTLFDPKDPTKPWLTVNRGNQDYQWMFTRPFSPAGLTHFIVVDLKALANCRALSLN